MAVLAPPAAWPSILENIRGRVSDQQFATWFQNLQAISCDETELNIRVPHQFFKEWLTHNYLDVIARAVEETIQATPRIVFTIDESMRRRKLSAPDATVASPFTTVLEPERMRGLPLNPQYTFETFVVGPSNQLAHAAAMAVTAAPGRTYNPLFMHGSVGLGKSHLLQAICHASLANRPKCRIAYLSCETFVNEFISAIQKNDLLAFRDRYRQLDLLLIDDIQFLSRAERSQEEFFHTFNDLYNAQRQIVLSSDQSPHEISGLQERLISRFKCGLVARIDPASYEMRVAILKRKAELRGVTVGDDVVDYIATTITTNIRELDGAITKIVGYASLLNQPINMEIARTALKEPPRPRAPVTIDDIVRAVTTEFHVKLSDLQSRKRTRSIVYPRQICMYLARRLTLHSLEEIGGYFGGRDHSTVLHAEDKIREDAARDHVVATRIEKLLRDLNLNPDEVLSRASGNAG